VNLSIVTELELFWKVSKLLECSRKTPDYVIEGFVLKDMAEFNKSLTRTALEHVLDNILKNFAVKLMIDLFSGV